jgi:BirA family biotin operon repressor/biotin-[acetyl-CoA-carboxylase] ligase
LPIGLFRLHHHALLDSTNEEAKRLAQQGCAHGTVVWADEQTAGQGRNGRRWESLAGNLMLSVVLRPTVPSPRAAELGFVSAVAMAACVAGLLPRGAGVSLKWPNDVQIEGAKVAGLLPEAQTAGGGLAWVVLGAGLNLAHAPAGLSYPATCLRAHGATVTPEQGLQAFLTQLAQWLTRWDTEGFSPVRDAWLARVGGLGREVTVTLGDRQERGLFRGLDDDGAMILATGDGFRRITAGDVAFGAV